MKTKSTGLVRAEMGRKQESFLTEAAKFVKKQVNAVETKLENDAREIATTSTILGISIGIVVGIVGTVLMQKYVVTPEPPVVRVPPQPPAMGPLM
jgi:hypothetical protein